MKLKNNVSENSLRRTFAEQGFDESQIRFLINSVNENVDIQLFANTKFSYEKMRALKDGLILGFDMKPCVKAKLDVLAIREEIERLMNESNFDPVRRQKYHRCVSNIYVPLKAALDLQF